MKECSNELCQKEAERLDKAKKALEKFLDYLDNSISGKTTDDIDRLYKKDVEIRIADRSLSLPMTDVVYQALYDALVKIEEEL